MCLNFIFPVYRYRTRILFSDSDPLKYETHFLVPLRGCSLQAADALLKSLAFTKKRTYTTIHSSRRESQQIWTCPGEEHGMADAGDTRTSAVRLQPMKVLQGTQGLSGPFWCISALVHICLRRDSD